MVPVRNGLILNRELVRIFMAEPAVSFHEIIVGTVRPADLLPHRRGYVSAIIIKAICLTVTVIVCAVITGCFRCFSGCSRLTLGFNAACTTARRIVRLANAFTACSIYHIVFINLTVTVSINSITCYIARLDRGPGLTGGLCPIYACAAGCTGARAALYRSIFIIRCSITVIIYAVTIIIRYSGGNTVTFRIIVVCQTIAVFIENSNIVADFRVCAC
jgi:hypothetical protein